MKVLHFPIPGWDQRFTDKDGNSLTAYWNTAMDQIDDQTRKEIIDYEKSINMKLFKPYIDMSPKHESFMKIRSQLMDIGEYLALKKFGFVSAKNFPQFEELGIK